MAVVMALVVTACGGESRTSRRAATTIQIPSNGNTSSGNTSSGNTSTMATGAPPARRAAHPKPAPTPPRTPSPPSYPRVLSAGLGAGGAGPHPVVTWRGRPAAWIAHLASGVTLLSIDQRLLELHLHSGTIDAGTAGWRYGPSVAGLERRRLVAAFNGGFRLSVGVGGFASYGHVAVPLRDGLGSIVIYADGTTNIGAWHAGVPAGGRPVASVRQNLPLLLDHGRVASSVDCVSCWGATLGGVSDPARSALGITAGGRLIWAGGEHLTVAQLSGALAAAQVARAVELDINPEWVAGYVYGHRGGQGPLAPIPIVDGQPGIPGQFLAPWSRDFFTVVAK